MSVNRSVTNHPSRSAPMLQGKIVPPQHAGFDEARQAWNLAVDQRPAAVVYAESAADVVATVRFAQEQGLRVAPQGTGHNAGPLGSLEDTILLKTEDKRPRSGCALIRWKVMTPENEAGPHSMNHRRST